MDYKLHLNRKNFIAWFECDDETYESPALDGDKIIFLDIDGVLNDEGLNYKKGVIIDTNMVAALKQIVDHTRAKIILSSSWRLDYLHFVENDYHTKSKELMTLDKALTEANLSVKGITPITPWTGPASRPAEISMFLRKFPDTKYVILDDDDFWMWGELLEHLVLTKIPAPRGKFQRGLTQENVNQAIEILQDGFMSDIESTSAISARTLHMIDEAVENLKRGTVSEPIDLSEF